MLTLRRDKLIVCVSEQQASVALWRAGTIAELQCFPCGESGLADFREFLGRHPATPVSMIVDAVDEDYRVETLPHSRGSERKQMVTRKLKQLYRNTPFTGAWLQGREKGKRRDDRFLFAALTNPDLVTKWLRVVHGQALPFSGLYLLPMVSAAIAEKLKVRTRNLAIATHHGGRLRVTFLREGQLRLSRVTRTERGDADTVHVFSSEISNTRLHLHALRMATLDERLTVLLLDPHDALQDVVAALIQDNPALRCLRMGGAEIATKLHIGLQHLVASPESLHMQLLAQGCAHADIAPAEATAEYRHGRIRRTMYAACAGMGALAALSTGMNGWLAHGVRTQTHTVESHIVAQQTRYEQIARDSTGAPMSGEAMKRAVEIAQRLRDNAREPTAMMAAVSRALQDTPAVVLHEFGWAHAASDIQKGRDANSMPATAHDAGTVRQRRQSVYLAGEITPFRGDYRAAIATVDDLAQRLRQLPAVAEVRVLKMPLNISPSATLSGSALDRRDDSATAGFELMIVYKPRA